MEDNYTVQDALAGVMEINRLLQYINERKHITGVMVIAVNHRDGIHLYSGFGTLAREGGATIQLTNNGCELNSCEAQFVYDGVTLWQLGETPEEAIR